MLADTHCHLDADAYVHDLPAVIDRALGAGLARMLTPGTSIASSQRCIEIAEQFPPVYAAVGVHPEESHPLDSRSLDRLRELAEHPKVAAIGEIGLDYYWVTDAPRQAQQRDMLQAQLHLAAALKKPVILHVRESGDATDGPCFSDMLALLEEWLLMLEAQGARPARPGVLHSFSGSLATARRTISLGFFIGVTGPITFKNAAARRELIAELPLESLLIETDSPYLTPVPHRGTRNEPAYVAHIADKIAVIQSRSTEEVATVTGDNAARLFAWGEAA